MKLVLFIFGLLSFSFISADASVEGLLKIEKSFTYHKGSKTLTVGAGTYKTDLKNRSTSLTLKFKDGTGQRQKIKMQVPRNQTPSRNGSFQYESAQIEQPFDLQGHVTTQEERTPSQVRLEMCTYQIPIQVCQVDQYGRRICHIEYRNANGNRQIQFHYLIERSVTSLSLTGVQDRSIFGNFSGTESNQHEVLEFAGPCYP